MSKDAWIGQGEAGEWFGGHDGPCADGVDRGTYSHHGSLFELGEVIIAIEQCLGHSLAWSFRAQDNGIRLVSYLAPPY